MRVAVEGLSYIEILPDYQLYGKGAPLKRNMQIVECADLVVAFWDGVSRGTKYTIDLCSRKKIPVQIHCFP